MSNPHDYTVGWICAVSTERVAAEAFLDEEHEPPASISPHDDNNYKLGRIGRHMVVMAVLPDGEYGITSAACVAKGLLHSFPNVRVGLMVGIGGGAPSGKHDIRLGDVVVGATRGGKSSILQYDFGKAVQNQPLQLTGFMNQSPTSLRAAVSGLRSHYEGNGHTIKQAIEEALAKKPRLRKKYKSPGQENDRLYQSHIIHQGESCPEHCGGGDFDLVARAQRTDDEDDPMIHYGVIASADKLMKDATIRDRLAQDHDVLCFEMEAAGLMNHFPCLIIRGICDYSDTHKNDQWQGYAAMVAAAYAKDLLLQIIPSRIESEAKIADVLSDLKGSVNNVIEELKPVSRIIHSQHDRDILEWLASNDYAISQKDIFTKAEPGTGQWFMESRAFQTWLTNDIQSILCWGNPGAGKTVITSMVINHLLSEFQQAPEVGMAYIYCNYQRHTQQRATDILSSLLRQLAQPRSPLPQSVQDLYEWHERFRTHPTLEQILEALSSVAREYSKVYIIIDALDECNASDNTRATVLRELFRLQKHMTASIFATSRPNKEVSNFFTGSLTFNITATDHDIRKYLDKQISMKESLIVNDILKAEIEDKIVTVADGMFLLAALQTSTVLSQPTKGDLLETLQTLNKGQLGLDDHYYQAMTRIHDQEPKRKALAVKILTWIVHSKRPLSLTELQHALAVRKDTKELDLDFIPHPEIILSLCAGLVVLDEESTIVRLVHYTTQEYFEREQQKWFEDPETEMTITCVTYLLFDNFDKADPQTYIKNFNFYPKYEGDRQVYLEKHPLYEYAAHHWGDHAHSASAKVNDSLLYFLTSDSHVNFCGHAILPCNGISDSPVLISGLHLTAYFGLWSLACCLLDRGFPPDHLDSNHRTPLSYAAELGKEAIVRLLIVRDDVNPNSSSRVRRMTPLMFAAVNGQRAVVNLLLERPDADVNGLDGQDRTPLHCAVYARDTSIAARLLEKGANLEKQDKVGHTALLIAAKNGDASMITLLIQNGANPNIKPRYGSEGTPLAFIAQQGHEEMVKLLLSIEGIVVDATDRHGRSPLHLASREGHMGVIRLLLQRDIDPDPVDVNGRTPFSYAAEMGHMTVAKLLLDTGKVNPNSEHNGKRNEGRTPLSYAAEEGQEEIVEFLLNTRGVDPDAKATGRGIAGKTPLMYAVWQDRASTVRPLLGTNGIRPDAGISGEECGGATPLSFVGGSEGVARLLLDTGKVDINSVCHDSVRDEAMTALDYSRSEAIICFLRERGAKYAREL